MPAPSRPEELSLDGPAGSLEARLELPEASSRGIAVVCHPHPQHGGTMQNKVVHTLCRAMNDLGHAALRFNFRGVGNSDGVYDEGAGEVDDALAVMEWARKHYPGSLTVAGFSFGAMVSIRAAIQQNVDQLVSIAPPVHWFSSADTTQPACPWLIVQGEDDELVDAQAVIEWINAMTPGPELIMLPGVSHFFHGKLTELRSTLVAALTRGAE